MGADPRNDLYSVTTDTNQLAPPYPAQPLSEAKLIGVMGDLLGDLDHARIALTTLADRDITAIIQLGDWGIIWPGQNWQIDLNKLSRFLARNKQVMYFLDGNHDWHPRLQEFSIGQDGVRWLTHNVGHLPRGYRTTIGTRFVLAALGGANSSDRALRTAGKDWWPEEQVTDADIRALGTERVDVLVAHESPLMAVDNDLIREKDGDLARSDALYADACRVMIRRAVLRTRPSSASVVTTTGTSPATSPSH
ncbi:MULTISPECIES: metallophosphoesterase [unclassified Cryobacterium]|uniref:metallophosphoesterase family protein n=1 Tax=unclassified Cryobacterium TaxID=2649013 RepID=UPI000CE35364|nr:MULTISPECIES: metallophosphoesterase [unclassified Cryobacterium]